MEPSIVDSDIYYPSIEDPDFNTKIVNNSEFSQYKTLMKEIPDKVILEEETRNICAANNFIHKNITKVVKTYISPNTPYNGILLYHGVGVGKTCNAITIAEQFQDYSKRMNKKIYIIAPPSIVDGFKTEIHNKKKTRFDNRNLQCTFDKYEKLYDEYLNTLEGEEKKDDFLNKYSEYEIFTPITFVNKHFIKGDFNKQNYRNNIKKLFDNSIIIIDEVHNLTDKKKDKVDISDNITYEDIYITKNLGEGILKNKMVEFSKDNSKINNIDWNKTYTELIEEKIAFLNDEIKLLIENEEKKKEIISFFKNEYSDFIAGGKELQHFLQAILSENKDIYKKSRSGAGDIQNYEPINIQCKLILLSATPMFDTYEEIKHLINLLKLNDKCKIDDLIDESINNIVELNFEEIKKSVSDEKNVDINNFLRKTQGYISYFKGDSPLSFPKKLYLNQNKQYINSNNTQKIDKWNYSENFEEVEIENTDNTIINSEISLTISIMNDKQEQFYTSNKVQKTAVTHKGIYNNFDDKQTSCKMNTIKKLMFNEQTNKIVKGKVFIFSRWAENNNKTNIMNNILDWFPNDNENKFVQFDIKNGKTLPIEKKNRVILIDSKNNDNKKVYIDIFNDEKNINGDYIKIIIGGETMKEGINLFGIRQLHILDPWWNISKNIQVVGRAFRSCSHILLPFEERNVTIFNHIAILENEKEEINGKIRLKINPNNDKINFPGGTNSDIRAAFKLSGKTEDMNKINYLIKINAFDCDLNKSNNFIKNFTDPFSMKVPFNNDDIQVSFNNKEDEYQCLGLLSDDKNIETRKYFGLDNNIQFIKYYIKNFFVEKNKLFFKFNELLNYLNYDKNIELTKNELMHNIVSIINNKETIYDIFNRKCYLYKNNDYYLLNPIDIIKINKEIKTIEDKINELRTKLNGKQSLDDMEDLINKYKDLLNSKIKLNSPSINFPYKNTFKFINNYMYFDKITNDIISENPISKTIIKTNLGDKSRIITLDKIDPDHEKNYIFERCAYLENKYILCIPKQRFKMLGDNNVATRFFRNPSDKESVLINQSGQKIENNKVFKKVVDSKIYEVTEPFIRHSQKPLYFYLKNENYDIETRLNNLNELLDGGGTGNGFKAQNILNLVEEFFSNNKYKRVDQPLLIFNIEFLKIKNIRIVAIKINYDTLQILFKFLIKKIAKLYENFKEKDTSNNTLDKYFELLLNKGFDLKYKEFNNINQAWNNIIDDESLNIYGWSKEELLFIYNNKHCFIIKQNEEIGFILFKDPGTIVNSHNPNYNKTTNPLANDINTLTQQLPLQVTLNYSIGHEKPRLTNIFSLEKDIKKTLFKHNKDLPGIYKNSNSQHNNNEKIKGLAHLINLYSFNITNKKWKIFTNANNNNFIRSISKKLKKKYYIPYEVNSDDISDKDNVLENNKYIVEIHKNYKQLLFIDRYIKLKNIDTSNVSFTNIRYNYITKYMKEKITDVYSEFLWREIEKIIEQKIYHEEKYLEDIWGWFDSSISKKNKNEVQHYTNIINIETIHNHLESNWRNELGSKVITALKKDSSGMYTDVVTSPHLLKPINLYFSTTDDSYGVIDHQRIKQTNNVANNTLDGFNIFKNITNYNILLLFKYIYNFNLTKDTKPSRIDIWQAQKILTDLNPSKNYKINTHDVNFIKILKIIIINIKKKIREYKDADADEVILNIKINNELINHLKTYYKTIQQREELQEEELETYLTLKFDKNHIINKLTDEDIDIYLVENNDINEEKDNLKIIISRNELNENININKKMIEEENNIKTLEELYEIIKIKKLNTYYLLDKYSFGDRIWFLDSYEMTVMDGIKYWPMWKAMNTQQPQIADLIIYDFVNKDTKKESINPSIKLMAPNNTTIENFQTQGGFTIFDDLNTKYKEIKTHLPSVEYQIFNTDELEDVKNVEKDIEWDNMDKIWWKLEILFKD
jgi:hypothetical protein